MKLALDNLQKSFGGLLAVRGTTFEARPGEILGLVGPNGAGKTTIFNMITGIVRPSAGRVLLDDRDITNMATHRVGRLGIGRTFQHTRIFHHLKVVDNIVLARPEVSDSLAGALMVGLARRRQWRDEAYAHLAGMGLDKIADEFGGDLSYAEQKLVMFACLSAGGANVFLLDEPTAGLDMQSQQMIIEVVKNLRGPGRTVVLIEHNLDVVRGCCDRVVFLVQGKVVASGTPAEVETDPSLRDLYFGSKGNDAARP